MPRGKRVYAKYPDKPKKASEIDKIFIAEYAKDNVKELDHIKEMAVDFEGKEIKFADVRKAFVKKYYPELSGNKRASLIELLNGISK